MSPLYNSAVTIDNARGLYKEEWQQAHAHGMCAATNLSPSVHICRLPDESGILTIHNTVALYTTLARAHILTCWTPALAAWAR